jgi:maleate isomerase
MYGWRARIGMLLPSVNTCAEPEFHRLAPPGVSFHATRLPLNGGGPPALQRMVLGLEDAARLLVDIEPDLILFHCTAGSMAGAPGYEEHLAARIEAATGRPAATTARAILAGLRALEARRIVLVTPYIAATNEAERAFLEGHGFAVVGLRGLGLTSGNAYTEVEPAAWYRIVREAARPEADAILVSCTNIRVLDAIAPLEADLRRPVVTSNQAALWYCLRRLHLADRIAGYGRLLAEVTALPEPEPVGAGP